MADEPYVNNIQTPSKEASFASASSFCNGQSDHKEIVDAQLQNISLGDTSIFSGSFNNTDQAQARRQHTIDLIAVCRDFGDQDTLYTTSSIEEVGSCSSSQLVFMESRRQLSDESENILEFNLSYIGGWIEVEGDKSMDVPKAEGKEGV